MNDLPQENTIRIARQFHWEMGHRLPFHTSGCANIHGHSYRLWVEIEGYSDANGMVMDYGVMKEVLAPVISMLDHCFLCDESDEVMKDFLTTTNFKVHYVPFTSTAEHIVEYLLVLLWERFSTYPNIVSLKLRLQETENTYAEASRSR